MTDPPSDPPVNPASAALQKNLHELLAESSALRTDVRAAEKVRRVKEVLLLVLIVLTLIVAGFSFHTAQVTQKTNDQIADCITPQGQCYRDGSKRQSGAVKVLTRVQIVVAVCSKISSEEATISACVAKRLAATK